MYKVDFPYFQQLDCISNKIVFVMLLYKSMRCFYTEWDS